MRDGRQGNAAYEAGRAARDGDQRYGEAVAAAGGSMAGEAGTTQDPFALGMAFEAAGDMDAAIRCFRAATGLAPGSTVAFVKLANALRVLGRPDEALACADRAIVLDPAHYGAHIIHGLIADALGRTDSAGRDFMTAFSLCPRSAETLNALGTICIGQARYEIATKVLREAAALGRDKAEPHGNLGFALQKQGRTREAFDAYAAAVTIDPTHVVAQCNLAGLLIGIGQFDAAISACRMAMRHDPGCIQAHVYLGIALRRQGRTSEAIDAYRDLLARRPEAGEALIEICDLRQQSCDWADLKSQQTAAMTHTYKKGIRVPPFQVLTITGSAAAQQAAARVWAAAFRRDGPPLSTYAPRSPAQRDRRLKIGYLSADFRMHATAMLIAELLERHDRRRFEIFGYSCGEDDRSPMRRRLIEAMDHVVDIRAAPHDEAARGIHADGIDILIDLKGYTQDGRPEILVRRPASIQVNYLGYPGTMGAPFIDYIIADGFIVRKEHEAFLDERIVRLPHSYQPNDGRRATAARRPTRAECGLPAQGFVFCCLNNTYKITPDTFETWMRLLRATPGSVLWLFDGDSAAGANLAREARARGVDASRLIFAPKIPPDAHLARLPLADLFLDTRPVNAHTTASEALWTGLPIVTLAGEAFASRVAGSLLHAVGLPDLVTTSSADYETLALRLASDPDLMKQVRARLHDAKASAPLFDTPRYTRNFEAALLHMAALRDLGRLPESFDVTEV